MTPPLVVVTGFLGSGKTTLLRQLLEGDLGDQRVALVVNELGAVGFDGALLDRAGLIGLVELTNGCICCAIGSDFVLAVEEIVDAADPDLIVVETTGVAEPRGLLRQLHAARLPLDALITVADAANLRRELELSALAAWQIQAADFLVLNKCDLVDEGERTALRELLRQLNPRAAIFPAVRGSVPAALLFGGGQAHGGQFAAADACEANATNHLAEADISSMLWESDLPLERACLEEALASLPAAIYRAKGFVFCTDAPWPLLVNVVCGRVDLVTTRFRQPPARLGQLVLIGAGLDAHSAALRARLDGCIAPPARVASWRARSED